MSFGFSSRWIGLTILLVSIPLAASGCGRAPAPDGPSAAGNSAAAAAPNGPSSAGPAANGGATDAEQVAEKADVASGVRGQAVKLVGSFLPGTDPDEGRRVPHTAPVHVFRGRIQPFEKPDAKHPALVKVVRPDEEGRFTLPLPPGEYTAVLELDGELYLNNWLEDGSWAIFTVQPSAWTAYTIEDVTEAEF